VLEGVEVGEGLAAPRGALGVWVRRAVLFVFAVVLALGLANRFGQVAATSDATSAKASLHVVAPSALRGGLIFEVLVRVRAVRPVKAAWLVFSPGWFSGITTNAEVPQPSQQTDRGGRPAFLLGRLAAGQTSTVRFYFQVNPTTVAWHRAEDVELYDGVAPLAVVHRTVNIYP
jgi:hypothetical protein